MNFIHPIMSEIYLQGKEYTEAPKSISHPKNSDLDDDMTFTKHTLKEVYKCFSTLEKLVIKKEYDLNLFPRSKVAIIVFSIMVNRLQTDAEKINFLNSYYSKEKAKRTVKRKPFGGMER